MPCWYPVLLFYYILQQIIIIRACWVSAQIEISSNGKRITQWFKNCLVDLNVFYTLVFLDVLEFLFHCKHWLPYRRLQDTIINFRVWLLISGTVLYIFPGYTTVKIFIFCGSLYYSVATCVHFCDAFLVTNSSLLICIIVDRYMHGRLSHHILYYISQI